MDIYRTGILPNIHSLMGFYSYIHISPSINWGKAWQWRRLHRARGKCPHFYKWLCMGVAPWVEEQQTISWPTRMYCPSRKRSPKRLIVLVKRKKGERQDLKYFAAFCAEHVPPLSNSFRRHWVGSPRHFAHSHHYKESGGGLVYQFDSTPDIYGFEWIRLGRQNRLWYQLTLVSIARERAI